MNRRRFLTQSTSCCAHLAALGMASPVLASRIFQDTATKEKSKIVAKEKWGTLEKIHDGAWTHVSDFSKKDYTTVCNGGIIEGKTGVLAIEAFNQPKGAKWLADQAKELTGKWPTDIVCTHYHPDHTSGHSGYFTKENEPRIWLTKDTHKASLKSFRAGNKNAPDYKNVSELSTDKPTEIDLGGRKVKVVPRTGHTSSDVTIELVDPNIVFCGDLFFNRMFPNYRDASPAKLNDYVSHLLKNNDNVYVPGHGPVADREAVKSYQDFLSFIQEEAEKAHKSGKSPAKSAKDFKLPESLKDWLIWSPAVVQPAFIAWNRHFDSASKITDEGSSKK